MGGIVAHPQGRFSRTVTVRRGLREMRRRMQSITPVTFVLASHWNLAGPSVRRYESNDSSHEIIVFKVQFIAFSCIKHF